MIITFGKHKGKDIRDVPDDYILWLIDRAKEDVVKYSEELRRREAARDADCSMVQRIIKEGFRSLALKLHPDKGGTNAQMRTLNAAKEWLDSKTRDV